MSVQGGQGRVYYFDFGIQRITGLHESEMEEYGSQYCISRADFRHARYSLTHPIPPYSAVSCSAGWLLSREQCTQLDSVLSADWGHPERLA